MSLSSTGVVHKLLTTLNDEETLSAESFKAWRSTDKEPEGKGNAVSLKYTRDFVGFSLY